MMNFSKIVSCGAAIALVSAGAGAVATAQDWSGGEPAGRIEARLNDRDMLFNATIKNAPEKGDIEHGRLVAMGGAEKGGAGVACFTCHGPQGIGDGAGAVPRIAGMPAWYLFKQLNDYAGGARPHAVMTGIAQMLSERERRTVSQYYALTRAPYPGFPDYDGRQVQRGQRLAAVGSAEQGIPACVNCHGANGSGMPPSVPYLAGQYADYTTLQLQFWKDGQRANDAMNVMRAIATKMSDDDIKAVARYYEKVRPIDGDPINGSKSGTSKKQGRGNDQSEAQKATGEDAAPQAAMSTNGPSTEQR